MRWTPAVHAAHQGTPPAERRHATSGIPGEGGNPGTGGSGLATRRAGAPKSGLASPPFRSQHQLAWPVEERATCPGPARERPPRGEPLRDEHYLSLKHPMRLVAALMVALAAGCGSKDSPGPWLTDPGVNGHTAFFPLAGTPHDPAVAGTSVTCEACHPGNTFAEFDCTTCHAATNTDSFHTGVAGYTHTSAACLGCHPTGTVAAPADHDTKFFPRGRGRPTPSSAAPSATPISRTRPTRPTSPAPAATPA